MNAGKTNRNYRNAFTAALLLNLVFLAVLMGLWWRGHANKTATASDVSAPVAGHETTMQDAPMAPVQFTPQRMQSIGVKVGKAQFQQLEAELRVTGTVEVDERRLAYVQTRFPGWIRKLYANATYQYIRKGQPLFTIYSPDLVTTEQEYLLARKNSESLQSSTVSGVSLGAQSLLSAARERLEQWEVPASE